MAIKFQQGLYRCLFFCTAIVIWKVYSHHLTTTQFKFATKIRELKSSNDNRNPSENGMTSRYTISSFYGSPSPTTEGKKKAKSNKLNAAEYNTGILEKLGKSRMERQGKYVTSDITTAKITATARAISCDKCFKRPYPFIINSDSICHGLTNSSVSLLVFILTTHNQQERRDVLRNTWASLSRNNTSPFFRYVFLLGSSGKESGQKLQAENNIHHDMVQQNFSDSYRNLTLKTMMGFEWFTWFCSQASYVMKTDDDVYINVTNILRLAQQPKMQNKILGCCSKLDYPIRFKSKWTVTLREYPQKTYPGFCHGVGYVMSKKVAKDIHFISEQVPFLYLEDVYIGLCAHRLRVPVQPVPGFWLSPLPITKADCGKYGSEKVFAVHGLTPQKKMSVWKKCETFHNSI